jgi:uncharacterized membrane protein YbhN (UPF0104 family)
MQMVIDEKSSRLKMTSKKILIVFSKLLMTLVFIVFLAFKYNFRIAFRKVIDLPIEGIALTLTVYCSSIMISVFRWKLLYPHGTLRRLCEVTMIGHFFAMLLPGQLFGEASKIVYLAEDAKRSDTTGRIEELAMSIAVDKIAGLIGMIVIGIAGAVLGSRSIQTRYLSFCFIAALIGLSFILVCLRFRWCSLLFDYICVFCETKLPVIKPAVACLRRAVGAWLLYLNSPTKLAASLLMGFLYQAMIISIHVILCRYLKIQVSFFDLCWICAVQSILILLPVTIAGIGLREGGYVGTLGFLGVSASSSLSLSLSIFSLQIMRALAGGIFVMKNSVSRGLRL